MEASINYQNAPFIMVLSSTDIARYHRLGYLTALPALSPEESWRLRTEIAAFGRRHKVKEQFVLRNKAHLKMPMLAEVVRNPQILEVVAAILGPDILCWGSSVFIKEAHGPEQVAWHQDSYYYDIDTLDVCTVWVALTPSTHENGVLRVVPGSHTAPAKPHGPSRADSTNMLFTFEEISAHVNEDSAVELPLDAGQFSIHHVALVHGSMPNLSIDRRIGLSITYLNTGVRHYGRRKSGQLVRGENWGQYTPDPLPTREMDPEVLAFVDAQFGSPLPRGEFMRRSDHDSLS